MGLRKHFVGTDLGVGGDLSSREHLREDLFRVPDRLRHWTERLVFTVVFFFLFVPFSLYQVD